MCTPNQAGRLRRCSRTLSGHPDMLLKRMGSHNPKPPNSRKLSSLQPKIPKKSPLQQQRGRSRCLQSAKVWTARVRSSGFQVRSSRLKGFRVWGTHEARHDCSKQRASPSGLARGWEDAGTSSKKVFKQVTERASSWQGTMRPAYESHQSSSCG